MEARLSLRLHSATDGVFPARGDRAGGISARGPALRNGLGFADPDRQKISAALRRRVHGRAAGVRSGEDVRRRRGEGGGNCRVLREHTGLRLPPGAIIYGLETYLRRWRKGIAESIPRALAWPSRMAASLLCGGIIARTVERAQGWYGDGWAARRVRYMVSPGAGRVLVVAGWIPASRWRNQRLTIVEGRRTLGRREFFGGDFNWRVPLPDGGVLALEIRASRSVVPALGGRGSGDRRRLAYFLRSVGVEYGAAEAGAGDARRPALLSSGFCEDDSNDGPAASDRGDYRRHGIDLRDPAAGNFKASGRRDASGDQQMGRADHRA